MVDANPENRGSDKSFDQLAEDERGTVYVDAYENGVRYLIMRGGASLCAYVGVPADHPLAGHSSEDVSLDCHGGLTWASEGEGDSAGRPTGWYWYGWDYAHAGDRSLYDVKHPDMPAIPGEREWTVEDVQKEIWDVTYEFAKLKSLAEAIAFKRGAP